MIYALLKTAHLLAIIVWIGGMAFAHFFLRPALAQLDPPVRLSLMRAVLGRFFSAVMVGSLVALGSGAWMLGSLAPGMRMPGAWMAMAVLGVLMVAIFMHVRFALYPRLVRAVDAADWPAGGQALAAIRQWVAVNLAIGVAIVLVTLLGR
jgi:uncharacterized membrane protein